MKKFYKISRDAMFKSIFCKEENWVLLERLIEEVINEKVKIIISVIISILFLFLQLNLSNINVIFICSCLPNT